VLAFAGHSFGFLEKEESEKNKKYKGDTTKCN
jgi:hypothetical protein